MDSIAGRTDNAELYTYSLVWGIVGLILLILAIRFKGVTLRFASLAVMLVTVVKVFVIDTSHLHNLLRVLSVVPCSTRNYGWNRALGMKNNVPLSGPGAKQQAIVHRFQNLNARLLGILPKKKFWAGFLSGAVRGMNMRSHGYCVNEGRGTSYCCVVTLAVGFLIWLPGCSDRIIHKTVTVSDNTHSAKHLRRPCLTDVSRFDSMLEAAIRGFSYHGALINPRLLDIFRIPLDAPSSGATGESAVTQVDVTQAYNDNTNGSMTGGTWKRGHVFGYDRSRASGWRLHRGSFGYIYLGLMTDGTDVIETIDNGGGSGVFESLVCVRFAVGRGLRQGHLLMSCLAVYPIGDRYDGKITLIPQGIKLGAYQGPAADYSYPKRFIHWPATNAKN